MFSKLGEMAPCLLAYMSQLNKIDNTKSQQTNSTRQPHKITVLLNKTLSHTFYYLMQRKMQLQSGSHPAYIRLYEVGQTFHNGSMSLIQ